jgi:hydrogenase nickel incorporation protein HypB
MFSDTDTVLLNKIDLQPYLEFDFDSFKKAVTGLNPDVVILPLSCKTGEGIGEWFTWLESAVKEKKKK